jgi:hypothetical protein
MGDEGNEAEDGGTGDAPAAAAAELAPWRLAGWIFRDGDAIAIPRHGDEVRARVLAD